MNPTERDKDTLQTENELVELLRSSLSAPGDRVKVSIGDDAAVIDTASGSEIVFTTDTFVQGVHFNVEWGSFEEIGFRSMAGALSDIAAMGGIPVAALIALGLPTIPDPGSIRSLYSGFGQCARKYGCTVAGGETVRTTGDVVITISVIGDVAKGSALLRSGAGEGDSIYVSGTLGRNTAALRWLQTGGPEHHTGKDMRTVFFDTNPRVFEALSIKKTLEVTSMIDISDGLSTDLAHVAAASRVGALLYETSLPIAEEARQISDLLGEDLEKYVLNGGEDHELLFTLKKEPDSAFIQEFKDTFGIPITKIGSIIGSGLFLERNDGTRDTLVPGGFDHLRRRGS